MPARLLWPTEVADPRAVVLVLPGGRAHSREEIHGWDPGVLRVRPFEWAVARAGRRRIAVASMRYAVRGWNGAEASPLHDTELALEQVAARHPGVPIGLLGYSMGGRVALHLAGDERVRAIAAVAPWVEGADRVRAHPGLHVLVMHGTRDRITSPRQSRILTDSLAAQGVDASWVAVADDGHSLLRRARRWHRETAAYLAQHLT